MHKFAMGLIGSAGASTLALVVWAAIPLLPTSASAQSAPNVVVQGEACGEEEPCTPAPPAFYSCIAKAIAAEPLIHGRLVQGMSRMERAPSSDSAELLQRHFASSGCKASTYRVSLRELHAATDGIKYLGRQVTIRGALMRDPADNIRVQYPNGQYPWIIDPASIDSNLIGSAVQVVGVTIGPSRLRAISTSRIDATAEIMTPLAEGKQEFIWCSARGVDGRYYISAIFPGDYVKAKTLEAGFASAVRSKHGPISMATVGCQFEPYINDANYQWRGNLKSEQRRGVAVVETGWRP